METVRIDQDLAGERIDAVLAGLFPERSRSFFQKLIKEEQVLVNGKAVKPSLILKEDDEVSLSFPEMKTISVLPEDIPLDIVYEDSDVILVNKPRGMVVHPAPGHYTGTMVNALLHHCGDLSGINGVLRPGIVHRIDRDTTGIVIACKNDLSHNLIASQLQEHSMGRRYVCLVHGNVKEDEGTVDQPLGRSRQDRKKMAIDPENGKRAVTHYRVLERFGEFTYVECRLETGRTHQIRVHMTSIGHPLAGDPVYGTRKCPFKTEGQLLHAYLLGFIHPSTHEYMEFTVPLPADFEHILNILRMKE